MRGGVSLVSWLALAIASLAIGCVASGDDGTRVTREGVHAGYGAPLPQGSLDRHAPETARPRCGNGPWVDLEVWILELRDDGNVVPLPSSAIGFDACPGYAVATDVTGVGTAWVPLGSPIVTRITAADHVPLLVSTSRIAASSMLTDVMPTLTQAHVLPGWAPNAPALGLFVNALGSGACSDPRDVTLTVEGHPEAHAFYMRRAWPHDAAPAASASEAGDVIFVTGLGAGTVRITATKEGCSARMIEEAQTGEFVLEPGAWTVGNVYVDD
jgi:hypothetical protein